MTNVVNDGYYWAVFEPGEWYLKSPPYQELAQFWRQWAPWAAARTDEAIAEACAESVVVSVRDAENHIRAVGRMVTDYRLRAWIEDVVVHPEHRQHGLGRLVVTLLEERVPGVEAIELRTQHPEFWQALGYAPVAGAMVKRARPA